MSVRMRLSPEDTRARIIDVAEEHFRRIGYAKTAVADIAAALGMSPANVYRFFPSKLAINDAICQRLMEQCHSLCAGIVSSDLPAHEKLRSLVLTLHRTNKAKLTDEHRLHDMVEVAMSENWPAIRQHICHMEEVFAAVIRQGIEEGRFRAVDAASFAATAFDACVVVVHPTMISQCADQDQERQAHALVDLILAALRP